MNRILLNVAIYAVLLSYLSDVKINYGSNMSFTYPVLSEVKTECRRAQVNPLCPHLDTIHASQFCNITYKMADLQFISVLS